VKLSREQERAFQSFWLLPAAIVIAAVLAATALAEVDRFLGLTEGGSAYQVAFGGSPEAARSILSTIAGSMLTLTALVFSITILVLQLASSQFSPRALRTFLTDTTSKVTLGVFLATFAFALTGLRSTSGGTPGQELFVPGLVVTGAFLLVAVSLGVFLTYIHHTASRIRVSSIISSIHAETARLIDRVYPASEEAQRRKAVEVGETEPDQIVRAPRAGVLASVDYDGILRLAEESDSLVAVRPMPGGFVRKNAELMRVQGHKLDLSEREVASLFALQEERTMEQDVAYGFRQLVDIAVRALSPGTNDPSTCVSALDRIFDLLHRLGTRPFPPEQRFDESGHLRLIARLPDWGSYVNLAFDEIHHYGKDAPPVIGRLEAIMEELAESLPADRAASLHAPLAAVRATRRRVSRESATVSAPKGAA